jgi:hypothetical protein
MRENLGWIWIVIVQLNNHIIIFGSNCSIEKSKIKLIKLYFVIFWNEFSWMIFPLGIINNRYKYLIFNIMRIIISIGELLNYIIWQKNYPREIAI